MRGPVLCVVLLACHSQPAPAAPPPVTPKQEVRVRKGVQTRAIAPDKAPQHGLLYSSFGLVNETFLITVDLDTQQLTWVIHSAKDGSEKKSSRPLTAAELTALVSAREKVWSEWVEPKRVPSAEYNEHLYLLDGAAVTHLGADGGFGELGVTGALAQRLKALAF